MRPTSSIESATLQRRKSMSVMATWLFIFALTFSAATIITVVKATEYDQNSSLRPTISRLIGEVYRLDVSLSSEAELFVLTADDVRRQNYNASDLKLRETFDEMRGLTPASLYVFLNDSIKANDQLLILEKRAQRLTLEGKKDLALSILRGRQYEQWKKSYKEGMDSYGPAIEKYWANETEQKRKQTMLFLMVSVLSLFVTVFLSFRIYRVAISLNEKLHMSRHELSLQHSHLEQRHANQTQELKQVLSSMRMVFDQLPSAVFLTTFDGTVIKNYSKKAKDLFGSHSKDQKLWDYIFADEEYRKNQLLVSFEKIKAVPKTASRVLSDMTCRFEKKERVLEVRYHLVDENAKHPKVMVFVDDVTADDGRIKAEEEKGEQAKIFHAIQDDIKGFASFAEEGAKLIEELKRLRLNLFGPFGQESLSHLVRNIKLLSNHAKLFNFEGVSKACSSFEKVPLRNAKAVSDLVAAIENKWAATLASFLPYIESQRREKYVEITNKELDNVIRLVREEKQAKVIETALHRFKNPLMSVKLQKLKEFGLSTAKAVGKDNVEIIYQHNDIRLPLSDMEPLFAALCDAVKNAIVHGVESRGERRSKGKNEVATIKITAELDGEFLKLSIDDDGAGVNFDKIKLAANKNGFSCDEEDDLHELLFEPGVSVLSGEDNPAQGLGLSMIKEITTYNYKGTASFTSAKGKGSRLHVKIPTEETMILQVGAA